MEKMKYPEGYVEEFEGVVRYYNHRRFALLKEHKENGTLDQFRKMKAFMDDEMLEKLHQVRAKYGVPDPTSEDDR